MAPVSSAPSSPADSANPIEAAPMSASCRHSFSS
jgi:hypothetical protein